ncbi:tape measure protein [Neorhizobium galegae]|nr:tape measure protein [Neorhizobium galegae]
MPTLLRRMVAHCTDRTAVSQGWFSVAAIRRRLEPVRRLNQRKSQSGQLRRRLSGGARERAQTSELRHSACDRRRRHVHPRFGRLGCRNRAASVRKDRLGNLDCRAGRALMAVADLEKLVVQLSADITKFDRAMARAQGITNQRLGAIQKQALASSTAISGAFIKSGAAIAGAFIASDLVRNMGALSDAATRINNSLKVAGLSGAELESVYQSLNKAAIANGAPIETLATLYGRVAQNQKELGASTTELTGFTDNIALALRVAGTDATAASGALLQLGQALGGGVIQAEEYNSLIDGLLPSCRLRPLD